jgi:hypothetical protein
MAAAENPLRRMNAAEAAAQVQLAEQEPVQLREAAALAPLRLFRAAALPMQAAVAAECKAELPEPAVLVAAETALRIAQPLQTERPTPEAVGAAEVLRHQARAQAAQAALALSFSSTTSALPQSLPSSHRRIGLHQRVR